MIQSSICRRVCIQNNNQVNRIIITIVWQVARWSDVHVRDGSADPGQCGWRHDATVLHSVRECDKCKVRAEAGRHPEPVQQWQEWRTIIVGCPFQAADDLFSGMVVSHKSSQVCHIADDLLYVLVRALLHRENVKPLVPRLRGRED